MMREKILVNEIIINTYFFVDLIIQLNTSDILLKFKSYRFFDIILVFRVIRLFYIIDYMKIIMLVIKKTFKMVIYLGICNHIVLSIFALFGS